MPLGEGGEDFHNEQRILPTKKSILGDESDSDNNDTTKRKRNCSGGGGTRRPNEEKQRNNFVVPWKGLVANTAGSIL